MKATKQREIPAAMKPDIFAKISRRWPAIKWIKMLLDPDPSVDKWISTVLRRFADQKDVCCNKCKWAFIHTIRIAGEKKLALECFERSLQFVENDPNQTESNRQFIKNIAPRRIESLKAGQNN